VCRAVALFSPLFYHFSRLFLSRIPAAADGAFPDGSVRSCCVPRQSASSEAVRLQAQRPLALPFSCRGSSSPRLSSLLSQTAPLQTCPAHRLVPRRLHPAGCPDLHHHPATPHRSSHPVPEALPV